MNKQLTFGTHFILYTPWLLSLLLTEHPSLSYLVAWLGSFFIFYRSLNGPVAALSIQSGFAAQLLRPLILVQIVFAGYMCCTSIFYFLEIMKDAVELNFTAQCQRYYCLAHAALVSGMLVCLRPSFTPTYRFNRKPGGFIFQLSLICICLSQLLAYSDGLAQFSHQFANLSYIAGTLSITYALKERAFMRFSVSLLLYSVNFYQAMVSGYKEPVIISVMILGAFLYPEYKRAVQLIFSPLLLLLFILLPTYNRIFREEAWLAGLSVQQARQLALSATFEKENMDNNRLFFTNRLSEINMFTGYIQSTPAQVSHYGFKLIGQGFLAIIPRALWAKKPVTEQLVMARVYKAGVVHEQSRASAKPAFVVDAYLSGGISWIFICLFSYGALCQLIANKAENLFGGYNLGIAVIFTGLFQVFWRGQSFEFLFNTVFWSYICMYLIFYVLRFNQILTPNYKV